MVEVGGSNPPGPTNFLTLCFSAILFFVFADLSRVRASYLYPRKLVLKKPTTLVGLR